MLTQVRRLAKDERGFLEPWLLSFVNIVFILLFAVILTIGFGIYTKGYTIRGWMESSAGFAAIESIQVDDQGTLRNINVSLGRRLFSRVWQEKTNSVSVNDTVFHPLQGSILKGKAEIISFRAVAQGETLPNGMMVVAPGYWVEMDVVLWDAKVPFIGEVDAVNVIMRVFGVRRF